MITNKETLRLYLDADKFALGINKRFPIPIVDSIWIYQRTLRFYEYHKNVGNRFRKYLYSILLNIRGQRLGFSISGNCFGYGLRLNHYGLVIVNAKARIGNWCDIHQGVNIGENGYIEETEATNIGEAKSEVPILGNYCFIGPGAKIFGSCRVGDYVRIGANAVVCKDIADNHTAVGIPCLSYPNKKQNITIARKETEIEFLKKFPQYIRLIENKNDL